MERTKYKLPIVSNICLVVTKECNLNCKYCFVRKFGTQKASIMSKKIAYRVVRLLLKQINKSRKRIIGNIAFLGGEPLLAWKLIKDTVLFAEKEAKKINREVDFSISTNGTLLDNSKVNFIRKHNIKVQISIDSQKRKIHDALRPRKNGKGSYEEIIKNLRRFKDVDYVSITATITPENLHFFNFFKYFTKFKAVKSIAFVPVISKEEKYQLSEREAKIYKSELNKYANFIINNWMRGKWIRPQEIHINQIRSFKRKEQALPEVYCGGARILISIQLNGDIYACPLLEGESKYYLGNIFSGINSKLRKRLIGKLNRREGCIKCSVKDICKEGCLYCQEILNENLIKGNQQRYNLYKYELLIVKRFVKSIKQILHENTPSA